MRELERVGDRPVEERLGLGNTVGEHGVLLSGPRAGEGHRG
jgi:hypothetical protein